ncbi:UvrB/UvrC motif-containing protein, partial [Staphylococcus chromogenes]
QAFEEAAIVRDEIKALEAKQSEVSHDDEQS